MQYIADGNCRIGILNILFNVKKKTMTKTVTLNTFGF